jgi:hypothetical protein
MPFETKFLKPEDDFHGSLYLLSIGKNGTAKGL